MLLTGHVHLSPSLSDKTSEWWYAPPEPRRDSGWDQTSGHQHETEAVAYDWGVFLDFGFMLLFSSGVDMSYSYNISLACFKAKISRTLIFPQSHPWADVSHNPLYCMLQMKNAIEKREWQCWWHIWKTFNNFLLLKVEKQYELKKITDLIVVLEFIFPRVSSVLYKSNYIITILKILMVPQNEWIVLRFAN